MNAMVLPTPGPPERTPQANAPSDASAISTAYPTTERTAEGGRIAARGSRGGCFMSSGSPGSSASANAGTVSVRRLSHRICSGKSTAGTPASAAPSSTRISARLQLNR